MRKIEYIAVHCTAGKQSATVADVLRAFRAKGWKYPGYHWLVTADGRATQLLDEAYLSNGVQGWNQVLVNLAYTGGIGADGKPADTRTDAQKVTLRRLIGELRKKYPSSAVRGHRDFSPDRNGNGTIEPWEWIKACPCFDAAKEYADL